MFASHENMLFLHPFDLFTSPIGLALFHQFSFLFTLFLEVLDVYLLYLEFHSSQLDYVVLFEIVLLFDVAICDIAND